MISGKEVGHWTDRQIDRQRDWWMDRQTRVLPTVVGGGRARPALDKQQPSLHMFSTTTISLPTREMLRIVTPFGMYV